MADRQRGVQIHRGIIYGSHARLLTDEERKLAPELHTHRWTMFLTSATSPPPKAGEGESMDYIPGGADDLSYMLKKVTFRLHETYPNPSRVLDKPPYVVTETGWGEFTVQIRLQFVQESGEKPMTLSHPIKLHHWGAPIEGTAPPVAPSTTVTAAPTPAAAGTPAETVRSTTEVKEEKVETKEGNRDGDGDVQMADKPKEGDASQPKESTAEADAEGEAEETISAIRPDTALSAPAQAQPTGPVSIASRFPVHAWQYDELIFSDPPLAFYNILNEHPPTPLPARNRRPRDQRDVHTKKTKKGRMSAIASSAPTSRQGTPSADGAAPPAASVPGPGSHMGVGIPGEPGSADVPLEFTAEMEKAEWNKLRDAKRKIIDEMDRWRVKLIEEEKELQKLKDEMAAAARATPA